MNRIGSMKSVLTKYVFSYETPKLVVIESRSVGMVHKISQLALLAVVIIWVFIFNNGYQHIDLGAFGGTTTKIKGVAYSNSNDSRVGKRIWDTADLHVPPQDNGAFFLTTNVIVTDNQIQSVCPEQKEIKAACKEDADCQPVGKPFHLGHGVSTGVCNTTTKTCMVEAWCPIENDHPPIGRNYDVLNYTSDFTVLIKNHVYFPYFQKGRSNLIEFIDKKYLYNCRYDPRDQPYCPIFRIGDIVSLANGHRTENHVVSEKYFDSMAMKGGVISISIHWDCNFDYDDSECKPEYRFDRLDNFNNPIAKGYNFRYPIVYHKDGATKRQLIKAYGILFILKTDASAREFSFHVLILNIGSSLALISIASIISECLLLRLHKNRTYFKMKKIEPAVSLEKRASELQRNDISGENSSDCSTHKVRPPSI